MLAWQASPGAGASASPPSGTLSCHARDSRKAQHQSHEHAWPAGVEHAEPGAMSRSSARLGTVHGYPRGTFTHNPADLRLLQQVVHSCMGACMLQDGKSHGLADCVPATGVPNPAAAAKAAFELARDDAWTAQQADERIALEEAYKQRLKQVCCLAGGLCAHGYRFMGACVRLCCNLHDGWHADMYSLLRCRTSILPDSHRHLPLLASRALSPKSAAASLLCTCHAAAQGRLACLRVCVCHIAQPCLLQWQCR